MKNSRAIGFMWINSRQMKWTCKRSFVRYRILAYLAMHFMIGIFICVLKF